MTEQKNAPAAGHERPAIYTWHTMLQHLYACYQQDDIAVPEDKRRWRNCEGKSGEDKRT